jgi:predicted small metal-binding protein
MEIPVEETMLIRYSCKGMGLRCSFVVDAVTVEEVTEKALEHILEKHTNDFNTIQTPEEIEKMKKSLARSTRVVTG